MMIPVIVMTLYFSDHTPLLLVPYQKFLGDIACVIFIIAGVTDFFDGYIARKRNIVTVFGSFLDPIADKFLVVSSLIMLMGLERIHPVIVIILVLREMYMTSLRLLAMTEGIVVPVSSLGKWKTTTQMIAIPFLMIYEPFLGIPVATIGDILLYFAALLSLWSALLYSVSMIGKLREKRLENKKYKRKKFAKDIQ